MNDDQIQEDEIGNLILTVEQEAYAARENRRFIDTGYWLMINGHITWLYGTYYFELNNWWANTDGPDGLKEYRDRDRRLWFVWWQIKCEPFVFCLLNLKHRRAGATFGFHAEGVIACMEKELAMVDFFNFEKDTNKKRFDEMFKPSALKCKKWIIGINNLDEKSTKFHAVSPVKRASTKNARALKTAGTGGVINIMATTERGADGGKRAYILIDEFFKWDLIDFANFLDAQLPVVSAGGGVKKFGCIMGISSTEEISENNTAYERWKLSKQFYYDDKGFLRSPVGSVAIFFDAADCLEGFVDKFGDPIIDDPNPETAAWMLANPNKCPLGAIGSRRYLREKKAELLKMDDNRKSYNNFCRKHPESEEEAFMAAAGENSFNRDVLLSILSNIRSNTGPYGARGRISRGNFEWHVEGNIQAGAYFSPDPAGGRFYTNLLLNNDRLRNRMVRGRGGQPAPQFREKGCISVDPYSKDKTVDKKRYSLGAGHGILFFDYNNEQSRFTSDLTNIMGQRMDYHPTPSIFLSYANRPEDMSIFNDDILKACVYYGIPCSIESNVGTIVHHFDERGALNYLLSRNEYLDHPSASDYEQYGLNMSMKETIMLGYALVNQFLLGNHPHLSGFTYNLAHELEVHRLPFEPLVLDMLSFNINNRTVHDYTMSLFTGFIYYYKLFKHRTGYFELSKMEHQIIDAGIQAQSDLLSSGSGISTIVKDRYDLQAAYELGMTHEQYKEHLEKQVGIF